MRSFQGKQFIPEGFLKGKQRAPQRGHFVYPYGGTSI